MAESSATFRMVAIAAVTLVIGIFITSAVYDTVPSDDFTVDNESVTINYSETYTVENADIARSFYDNKTVYNSSDSELTEDTDYTFNTTSGELEFLDTADTTEGNEASITYSYEAPPEMASDTIGTVGSAFTLGAVAIIVLVAALILNLLGGLGGGRGGGMQ